MSVMSKDAQESAPDKSSAKVAAWSVLITMGGTSVTLNIWDATHAAHLFWLLAVLKGLAPVLAAMLLSEAGARFDGGKPTFLKRREAEQSEQIEQVGAHLRPLMSWLSPED